MKEYITPELIEFTVGFTFEENWTSEGKEWTKVQIKDAKDLAYWMDTYAFDSLPENYRVNNEDNLELNKQKLKKIKESLHET